jgi:hypothetical protein
MARQRLSTGGVWLAVSCVEYTTGQELSQMASRLEDEERHNAMLVADSTISMI